jgi:hypothetical protein
MVLDSALDPRLVWRDQWRAWTTAVAARLPDLTGWLAARDDTYHFGATAADVRRRFDGLADRLDRTPLTLPDGTVATGNYLRELTRAYLVDDELFPVIAAAWQALHTGTGEGLGTPPLDDNFLSAFYAISCDDAAWPGDPARYARDVAADRRRAPLTAGMPANIWPCAFWPNRPLEPPVPVTGGGRRNVLILQQTRDPSVPWTSAHGLRTLLGRGAALVTVDGGGHLTFPRGSCADAITVDFLATGTLPDRDRYCRRP